MQKWEKFTEEELKNFFETSKTAMEFAEKLGYRSKSVIPRIKEKYSWCDFRTKNNLAGQRFGRLIAIEPTDRRSNNNCIVWKCKCDCGNICYADIGVLRSGGKQSCGCLWEEKIHEANFQNLIGQKFGRLTPTNWERDEKNKIVWNCKCDCGNQIKVRPSNLKTGQTKSCGCLHAERVKESCLVDITGQSFGKLTVIEPTERRSGSNVVWKCKCECGKITYVDGYSLRTGNTKSCGCVNVSYYAEEIGKILNELNLSYVKEYSFIDLLGNANKLRFDYAIFNNNELKCLIEYQGQQHYQSINYFGGEEKFKLQQDYDNKKRAYCKNNNIKLIEIPYYENEKINKEYILNKIGGV